MPFTNSVTLGQLSVPHLQSGHYPSTCLTELVCRANEIRMKCLVLFTGYNGLNICISPNSSAEILTPKMMRLRGGPLGGD